MILNNSLSRCYVIKLLLFTNIGYSQNMESYQIRRISEIDSAYSYKIESKKLRWLSLAPSVSFNKNTGVNVSLSAASFIRYVQQRQRNTIERERYLFEQKARIEDEIISAEEKFLQLDIDLDLLDLSVKDLKILYEQYLIALSENANNEISHSDFLTVKYRYSSAWRSRFGKLLESRARADALELKYHTSLTSLSLDIKSIEQQLQIIKP